MKARHPRHPVAKKINPILDDSIDVTIGVLLDKMGGITPLHRAAYVGDLAKVTRLIEHGTDLTVRTNLGATPLHSAFFFKNGLDDWNNVSSELKFRRAKGKFDVAKLLIAKRQDLLVHQDLYRNYPLEIAPDHFTCARAGLLEGMKYMIDLKEADPMATTANGSTTYIHKL